MPVPKARRPNGIADRLARLDDLMSKVEDAPREWFLAAGMPTAGLGGSSVESLPCEEFAVCEAAWKEAMRWRPDMGDAMAVLLAVCASTNQAGNQLFLDLIGSPGGAKTTLCRGLLVSNHCIHLENVTKLISGFKKKGDDNADCSFLARANNKTWVTCEFDVLANSTAYHELMSKMRRIYDGETTATYGNNNVDRVYKALRTPWIRAGTQKMMDHDQAQLGDRFIRYILDEPPPLERREIALAALRAERAAIVETANCTSISLLDPKTRKAYALTGGYVDWLRTNVEEKIGQVAGNITPEVEQFCVDLADLSADLRARPQLHARKKDEGSESHEYKELPTRLARQNLRLVCCLAVALNKQTVDARVMKILRKVALNTSAGHSLSMLEWLSSPNPKANDMRLQDSGGLTDSHLLSWVTMTPEKLGRYLTFLRKMDVLDWRVTNHTGGWYMTPRAEELWWRVQRPL